jgi:hypothetical protein
MATKTISPLSLLEYRALVTNIPVYCANATFTVAGQTSAVGRRGLKSSTYSG